jgi:hydroxymethylpyrimidine/phosphomethylpyrimidine kinase
LTAVALTIAGSDPSGGAGIQADLKTFHQHGVYGEAVITLITVQNTRSVTRVDVLDAGLVAEQIRAVVSDIPPRAAKTGALGSAAVIAAVAREAATFDFPLVVDPVMISKHGTSLMAAEAQSALRELLIPRAVLLTPNLPEAAALTGLEVFDAGGMRRAAESLLRLGCRAVLVKGGHLEGEAVDLFFDGAVFRDFPAPRIDTRHTHGTGCTYSAAIAANLAKGLRLMDAIARARAFIAAAIQTNPGLGHGSGPVNHFAPAE